MLLQIKILSALVCGALGLNEQMISDYFSYKLVNNVYILSCQRQIENIKLVKHLISRDIRISLRPGWDTDNAEWWLRHANIGVLLDASCSNTDQILNMCSKSALFDSYHKWLIFHDYDYKNNTETIHSYVDAKFGNLNLSVDADLAVALMSHGVLYELLDVYNFGKIQGNPLEKIHLGSWRSGYGLNISLEGSKHYNRWDFHNLSLRAVTVIRNPPKVFDPSVLQDVRFDPGIVAMTKIAALLLNVIKERHNFRFNFTVVDRWVGEPRRNATPTVTNLVFWGEQDITMTSLRMTPTYMQWMEPFFPASTQLQTKFFYLVPQKGIGNYENRFLTPMSSAVWLCVVLSVVVCSLVLFCSAAAEYHPQPVMYAIGSVLAALCQQAYEDGIQLVEVSFSSQSRRLTLLVIGLTSMLMYNYYTSSVVSWLLSAVPPSIASIDELIHSDLELLFDDIGYNTQWLDSYGSRARMFYFSGFYNPKEDEMREEKVLKAKRKMSLLQTVEDGVDLIRTGPYAFHAEPYAANRVIGRRFTERELCQMGALQMMPPSNVYIMGQKRSPYREFFTWSMMRLQERGVTQVCRARVDSIKPSCSGQSPRSLSLGQAAPAFLLLAEINVLAIFILIFEILWHRYKNKYPTVSTRPTN